MKTEVIRDDAGIHFEIKDDGSAEYQKAAQLTRDVNEREARSREAMRALWCGEYEQGTDNTNLDAAPAAKVGADCQMSSGAAQSSSESDAQHPSAAQVPQPGDGRGTGNARK